MKAEGLPVKINLTASNYNSDDIPLIYKFAQENNIPVEYACYLFPSARLGKETDRPSTLDAAKNELICTKLENTPEKFAKKVEYIKNIAEKDKDVKSAGDKVRCRAGTAAFWITYEGKMVPCGMIDKPMASVVENGLEKAWQIINRETLKITLPVKCANCVYSEICNVCAATCYTETGRFDGVPEYLCKKTQEFIRLMMEEEGK